MPTEAEIAAAKQKAKFNSKLFVRSGVLSYGVVGVIFGVFTLFSWPNARQWESMDMINYLISEHRKKMAEKKAQAQQLQQQAQQQVQQQQQQQQKQER